MIKFYIKNIRTLPVCYFRTFNFFKANVTFLYPLKTSENHFLTFSEGVSKVSYAKEATVNLKMFYVTGWATYNYNTHLYFHHFPVSI